MDKYVSLAIDDEVAKHKANSTIKPHNLNTQLSLAIDALLDSIHYLFIRDGNRERVVRQQLTSLRALRKDYETHYRRFTQSRAIYSPDTCLYIIEQIDKALAEGQQAQEVRYEARELRRQTLNDLRAEKKEWQSHYRNALGYNGGGIKLYRLNRTKC